VPPRSEVAADSRLAQRSSEYLLRRHLMLTRRALGADRLTW
jgi:hypothetical protein